MKIPAFLAHHRIQRNPFAEEDAQTDVVFKECCIQDTFHPAWDKVYGDPAEPSTSIVFGEKGSGKTALRLQLDRRLAHYNREHPDCQTLVVHYDDFNPFLDRFHQAVGSRRKPEKVLAQFRLWDHIDAILSRGVSGLIDRTLRRGKPKNDESHPTISRALLRQLDRHQRRDLLLLAACYDRSSQMPYRQRWGKLRRRIGFWTWRSWWPWGLGLTVSLLVIAMAGLTLLDFEPTQQLAAFLRRMPVWGYQVVLAASWTPWLWRRSVCLWKAWRLGRHVRVIESPLWAQAGLFARIAAGEFAGQPLPIRQRTDDRYAMLDKFQSILRTLGYAGVVVLVDRIDEPHLINGATDRMRALLWPMLDNKFLKLPGMGVKFLLPAELSEYVDRENRDFYQRARLDKQNLIPSLAWSSQALCDMANARIAGCSQTSAGRTAKLTDLLADDLDSTRVLQALASLRVPRHVLRFCYRLLVEHCNKHAEDEPAWQIASDTFESVLAVYLREQQAAARGMGAG